MNVLLTGATGYIGEAVRCLARRPVAVAQRHRTVQARVPQLPSRAHRIDVLNQCRTDGGAIDARGIVRVVDTRTSAKLKVRFAGRGAVRHAALISRRGMVLRDYNVYQQELARIGGRVASHP